MGIVVERRAAVVALADALLERRVLDGPTVRAIIAAHPADSPGATPRTTAERTPGTDGHPGPSRQRRRPTLA